MCIFNAETKLPVGFNVMLDLHVTVSGFSQIERTLHAISHALCILLAVIETAFTKRAS